MENSFHSQIILDLTGFNFILGLNVGFWIVGNKIF